MKRLLILLTCICSISAYSQQAIDFNDYIPLKCQGPIPQDFKDELSQLVKITNEANIDKDINEKALESSFAELSNYQLNNILYSGNILYGDTLTSYINKVADVILKDDPALRSKLRFYVLKNTELNAYTTQKGIIFVSLGLLSRINNESQLAFILCHEIIHYRNNHNIESYKNTSRILNPDYKTNLSVKEKLHEIFTYSKAHESEADREGLLLFLKSPYSTDSLNNLFDVMLHSYLPFNEIPFSLFYFDSNIRHTFPKQYFLDSISGISSTKEDAADSMSSHPNIKSRRQSIDSLLRIHGKNTGALYVYPQSQFEYIQKTARYETTILHLENTELAAAFYNSYLIEKTYGKSKFSDKIIGSALYGLSKHKNYYDEAKYNDVLLDWTKTEGQQQGVYYFFNKIPAKELNILAASKLYTLYLSYNDSFFLDRFRSSMRDLILDYDIKVDFFKNDRYDTLSKVILKVPEKPFSIPKVNFNTKIETIKAPEVRDISKEYYRYSFIGMLDDSLLLATFEEYKLEKTNIDILKNNPKFIKYLIARHRLIKRQGNAADINTLVMTVPSYIGIHTQKQKKRDSTVFYFYKDPKLTPIKETAIENTITRKIKTHADTLKLNISILGKSNLSDIETNTFNDYQQLTRWINERTGLGQLGIHTYNDQYMAPYIKQYRYLASCQVANINKMLYVSFIVFDLKTNGSKLSYHKLVKKCKPGSKKLDLIFYEMLHQVKQKPVQLDLLKKKYKIQYED